MTRNDFFQSIHQIWCQQWQIKQLDSPQPQIIKRDDWSDFALLWTVNDQWQVVSVAVPFYEQVVVAVAGKSRLTSADLSQNAQHNRVEFTFLYPDDLKTPSISDDYVVCQLTTDDAALLEALTAAVSDAERDEADVGIDHALVYGVLYQDQLVAAASMFPWGGFADLGVLTHPDYRGRGLGRAVVAALAKGVLAQNEIALYRYDANNHGSRKVSASLGFTPYMVRDRIDFTG